MGKERPWLERRFMPVLYGILATAALIYFLRNPQYRTGSFNDDAIFVIGARDFWHPADERSQLLKPDYPFPGLPLLLSPVAKLVSSDWILLESVTIVFTVWLVYLMGLWSRKFLSAGEALAVTALLAFNPVIARLSGSVMGEIYYTAAIIASYYLLNSWLEKPMLKKALGLGFILGWGCLVRPEGTILLVSLAIPLLLKERGRRLLLTMTIPLAAWGAFAFYWFRIRQFSHYEYGNDLTALTSFWAQHFSIGLQFLDELLQDFLNHPLLSTKVTSHLSTATNGVLMIGFLAVIILGFRSLWKRKMVERTALFGAGIFCALYFGIHLFWHAKAARYSIPLLPFILVFLVRGVNETLGSLKYRRRWIQCAFVVVLLFDFYRNGLAIRQCFVGPKPSNSPPWRSLAWLRDHSSKDALVMSNIAPTVDLYTNRPSTNGIYSNNLEWLLYRFMQQRMNFLVLRTGGDFITPGVGDTQDPNKIWDRLRLWLVHYPQRFQILYSDSVEQTTIYRIPSEPDYIRAYGLFMKGVTVYRADRSDRHNEAFRAFNECLAIYPNLGSAYNFLGAIYLNRQDLLHAEQAFSKAVELLPDDPNALLNAATVYRMEQQMQRAQNYIQRVLDVSAATGDQGVWKNNINALYRDWEQRQARLFLDAPL